MAENPTLSNGDCKTKHFAGGYYSTAFESPLFCTPPIQFDGFAESWPESPGALRCWEAFLVCDTVLTVLAPCPEGRVFRPTCFLGLLNSFRPAEMMSVQANSPMTLTVTQKRSWFMSNMPRS